MLKRILSVIFILLIFSVPVVAAFTGITQKIAEENVGEADFIRLSWRPESDTPLTEEDEGSGKRRLSDIIDDFYSDIASLETKLENSVSMNFAWNKRFTIFNKFWCKYICGQNVSTATFSLSNHIYASEDKNRLFFNLFPIDDGPLGKIRDFSCKVNELGYEFLFVEAPTDPSEFNSAYLGVFDYGRTSMGSNADLYLDKTLILTDLAIEEGLYSPDMFFRTDHHWLPQYGLWAAGKICDELNADYGYNIDISIFDISNYDLSYCDRLFLGSQGKNATQVYVEPERFPILTPKYDADTDIEASFFDTGRVFTGKMTETVLFPEILTNADTSKFYNYYGDGEHSLVRVHNKKVNDGSRILLIKDSMANCVYPFLSQVFEYIDVIDPRHFNDCISEFIEVTNPDIVLMLCDRSNWAANMYDSLN